MKHLLGVPENRRKFLIFAGDVVLLAAAILLAVFLFDFLKENHIIKIQKRPIKLYVLYVSSVVYLIGLYIFEMYQIRERYERLHIFMSVSLVSFVSFLIVFSSAKVLRINQITMMCTFAFFITSNFLLYLWRRVIIKIFLNFEYFIKNILFIDSDRLTEDILNEIKSTDYRVMGVISSGDLNIAKFRDYLDNGCGPEGPGPSADSQKIQIIVTALNKSLPLDIMKELYKYKSKDVQVYDSAYFYEILTRKVAIRHFLESSHIPYFGVDAFTKPVFKNIKRFIDFFSAFFFLIISSPFFLLIYLLIKLTSGSPVFYLQERLGFKEEPFNLIKFRTMIPDAEKDNGPQWASKNDSRVTRVGRFLRKTRLDELPQFINILKGEMSFVGPRPFRKYFVEMFEKEVPFYCLKFSIKPGLTGWAQVNHNYREDKQTLQDNIERLQYDLYYLKHASLFLDLFIILKTLQTLIRRPAY